jgi:hypothetical protein
VSGKKMTPENLWSRKWFNDPADPEMTALYLERYLNYGLTREELQSGWPTWRLQNLWRVASVDSAISKYMCL